MTISRIYSAKLVEPTKFKFHLFKLMWHESSHFAKHSSYKHPLHINAWGVAVPESIGQREDGEEWD